LSSSNLSETGFLAEVDHGLNTLMPILMLGTVPAGSSVGIQITNTDFHGTVAKVAKEKVIGDKLKLEIEHVVSSLVVEVVISDGVGFHVYIITYYESREHNLVQILLIP